MKIYLLHEIYNNDLGIDWYNIYPYTTKDLAIEHVSNEVNEAKDILIDYFETYSEYKSRNYIYKIEESDLQ